MKKLHLTLLHGVAALAVFCVMIDMARAQAPPRAPAYEIDRVIVVVNDSVITKRALDTQVSLVTHRLQQDGAPVPPVKQLQTDLLEQMVLERIQLQKAQQDGMVVDDTDIAGTLERLAQANGLSLEAYRAQVDSEGAPWSVVVRDVKNKLLLLQLHQQEIDSKIVVSDAEIADYLASDAANAVSKIVQTHARHILLPTGDGLLAPPPQLLEIKQKVNQGGDFEAFARSVSSDRSSASQGGDLGWLNPGETAPEFERAMALLKEGEISAPVRSPDGYHLIQVLARREVEASAAQKQEAARQAIGARKAALAYSDWLSALRDKAYIQYKSDIAPS